MPTLNISHLLQCGGSTRLCRKNNSSWKTSVGDHHEVWQVLCTDSSPHVFRFAGDGIYFFRARIKDYSWQSEVQAELPTGFEWTNSSVAATLWLFKATGFLDRLEVGSQSGVDCCEMSQEGGLTFREHLNYGAFFVLCLLLVYILGICPCSCF